MFVFLLNQMETVMMTMQAHSSAVQDSLKGYRFGGANGTDVPAYRFTDSQVRSGDDEKQRVGGWKNIQINMRLHEYFVFFSGPAVGRLTQTSLLSILEL